MTSHVTSYDPSAGQVRKIGRRAAQLVGLVAFTTLALLGSSLVNPADAAAKLCGDRGQILKRLEQGHDEKPQALGLSADGGVLEVLVSPGGRLDHPRDLPQAADLRRRGRRGLADAAAGRPAGLTATASGTNRSGPYRRAEQPDQRRRARISSSLASRYPG